MPRLHLLLLREIFFCPLRTEFLFLASRIICLTWTTITPNHSSGVFQLHILFTNISQIARGAMPD